MRAYQGRIFRLADHLERLYASAQSLGLQIRMKPHALARSLEAALKRSGLRDALVRVALFPNADRVGSPSIVVQQVTPPGRQLYERGVRAAVVPMRKSPVTAVDPRVKYSARLGGILAVAESSLRRADEAIYLDAVAGITESTASNLAMVKARQLRTPPCWLGLLAGITRQVVLELCPRVGLSVEETPLTRHDLYNADEVFLLSTTKEVLPVTRLDGRRIGPGTAGPWARRLRRAFQDQVRRELRLS